MFDNQSTGGVRVPRDEELMSEALVRIFENVVLTEEKSLQAGYFSDLRFLTGA
jgi:hypothetical protein